MASNNGQVVVPDSRRWWKRWLSYSITYRFIKAVRNQDRERVTKPGRYLLGAALVTAIAGAFPNIMVGAPLFSAFLALLILSFLANHLYRPRLTVQRTGPSRCVAGGRASFTLTLKNQGRFTALDVGAYEYRLLPELSWMQPPLYVSSLTAGQTHSFELTLEPRRRGHYFLPGPSSICSFPFGLTQSLRFCPDPQRLIVYPAFHPLLKVDIPTGARYQPGGIVLTSQVGESMEFIGNREYQPGDRIRDLHPRSWARVGYPVVKQYQEEFLTRVALVVDTHVPTRATRRTFLRRKSPHPLEAVLSLSAGIADYLSRQDYVVDLFAAGPELYHFQAGRSLAYLENILDILACIEECPGDPWEVVGPRLSEELERMSTLIVLLLDWDSQRQSFLRQVISAGVMVKPILISDRWTDADQLKVGVAVKCLTPAQVVQGIDTL